MRSTIKKHVNTIVILSFVILSFLSVILLMNTHSLSGNSDIPMHLQQLKEVQLAIQHHTLAYYGLSVFHGSAIMTLYPWLNLWPAGLLAIFIKSRILVIYLFFMLYEFVGFLISYFSSLNFDRSKRISYLFSVFYGLSTLYLDYGFADSDYGELLTMTFLPLVIFGVIALFRRGNWLELSTGMTLIIGSHVLNTIIVIALLIIFFAINIFKIRIKTILNLGKAVLLTTFTTIAVWLPAVRLLHFNPQITTPPNYPLYGTPFREIVDGAIKGEITYGIGIFALAGIFLGALYFLTLNHYTRQFYVISVFIMILCSAWFKWWYLMPQALMKFQFTWRLYIIPEVCLSYIAAKVIVHVIKRFQILNVLIIIGLILLAIGVQFEGQRQINALNGKAPVFNSEYLINNDRPYFQNKNKKVVYMGTSFGKHPHSTIKTPEDFRFKGDPSYDAVFDQKRFFKTGDHYWPFNAKAHYNEISNHYVQAKQGLFNGFYNNGYNHYGFSNHRELSNVYLPIIVYSGEHLRITMDGHRIPVRSNQNVLFLKRLSKGNHQLSINLKKNSLYQVCEWSLIIGLLIYVLLIILKCI